MHRPIGDKNEMAAAEEAHVREHVLTPAIQPHLRKTLDGFFPISYQHGYRVSVAMAEDPDHLSQKRVRFCRWILEKLQEDNKFLDCVFFTHFAHFHLDGTVKRENAQFWGLSDFVFENEKVDSSESVTVWYALSRKYKIGPFFLLKDNNGGQYRDMLQYKFIPALQEKGINDCMVWFQQDSIPDTQVAPSVITWLRSYFFERVISEDLWPPASPDLNPVDFFLWGYLKKRVYQQNPKTVTQLTKILEDTSIQLSEEILPGIFDNAKTRWSLCLQLEGKHIEPLTRIYKPQVLRHELSIQDNSSFNRSRISAKYSFPTLFHFSSGTIGALQIS